MYTVAEATFTKNILLGSQKASSFELLYKRRPPLLPFIDRRLPPPITISRNAEETARPRINSVLRGHVHTPDPTNLGDSIAIWKDGSGWLFFGRVTEVAPYYYEVVQYGRNKSSVINRPRLIKRGTDDGE